MDILVRNAKTLVEALESYRSQNDDSYFPLDTSTVEEHIIRVKTLVENRDMSHDARLDRLFGKDELQEPFTQLANLARSLADRNDGIHDALLYVDGHLIE